MPDTVTGYTAARMQIIEDQAVVGAAVVGDNLVMTRYNATTFVAGNVRGLTGPMNPDGNPAGTIIMGGWGTEPVGYLFFGQTIVGGVATYPDLASIYPSWVSGGNLVIPNADGSVPMQSTPVGTVAGSMTHTLSGTQLPAHTHTGPSHTHTPGAHSHTYSGTSAGHSNDHSHFFTAMTSVNGSHAHTYERPYGQAGAQSPLGAGQSWHYLYGTQITDYQGDHQHSVSGQTGGASAGHTHTYSGTTSAPSASDTGASGTAATGNGPGTSATIDHTPKHLKIKYAVKT